MFFKNCNGAGYHLIKRIFDIVVSLIALVFVLPITLVVFFD